MLVIINNLAAWCSSKFSSHWRITSQPLLICLLEISFFFLHERPRAAHYDTETLLGENLRYHGDRQRLHISHYTYLKGTWNVYI